MEADRLRQIIERTGAEGEPDVRFIKRAEATGSRLGVFASSFNPATSVHVELMRLAARQFSLDETLALAGKANADKTDYDCPLEERLMMLALAFADDSRASIGVASHAYFVDLAEALVRVYPSQTRLLFILGFDTFERVLDPEDKYIEKYHRKFSDRAEALRFLLTNSRLIVAGRSGRGEDDLNALLQQEAEPLRERVYYLDAPAELGERSATEVRERLREGLSIAGLVPPAVEQFIKERKLYR